MSYRDDVEAVYQRAAALQREVDRLQAELAAERAPPAPTVATVDVPDHLRERTRPMVPPPPPPPPPPARVDGKVRVPAHLRERTPPVWLPTASPLPARPAPVEVEVEVAIPAPPSATDVFLARLAELDRLAPPDGVLPDPPTASDVMGLMVAKLSEAEFALMVRLLEVLTEDDFSSDALRRNLRALEIIAAELRIQLGVPR